MRPDRNDRGPARGFTLIELLVVIAIIAVLVALLLPAVQSAREASRRLECVNNLMQLGLALKSYETSFETLPAGVVDSSNGPILNQPKGQHVGWIVQILPFMEQRAAYQRFKIEAGVYAPENVSVRAYKIRSLLCPSDPVAVNSASSSYAGCNHDAEAPIGPKNHGVFILNRPIRYEEIEDGTSNTIFVSEKLIEPGDLGWASGTSATLRNTGTLPSRINMSRLPVSTLAGPADGTGVPVQAPAAGKGGASASEQSASFVGGFSSRHPGGMNASFGDGSVRFVKSSINPRVYQLLANRADGELVSADQY